MTNVKGFGASLGVAIGSSFVYENEIDFDIEATFSHKEASKQLIDKFKDRKSTRLNSSHSSVSRMPSSA